VLWRIFGTTREGLAGGWKRLHCEELRNLYCSPNITRVMKSRGIRWAEHVTRMEEVRNAYSILIGKNLKGRDHLGDLSVDGPIKVKWILKKKCEVAQVRHQWRSLVTTVHACLCP